MSEARLEMMEAGVCVLRNVIGPHRIDAALRLLNLAIAERGITPEQVHDWSHSTWFPDLRDSPEILAFQRPLGDLLGKVDREMWADPQILLRFPNRETEWKLQPHVDELPDWAPVGAQYTAICGVALSPAKVHDGCLVVWRGSHYGGKGPPTPIELDAGDVVFMHPLMGHSGMLNRGGRIRYMLYFRLFVSPVHLAEIVPQ